MTLNTHIATILHTSMNLSQGTIIRKWKQRRNISNGLANHNIHG